MKDDYNESSNSLTNFTALKNILYVKLKDNIEALERRVNQCKDGRIEKLLINGKMIQERLFKGNTKNLKATQSSDRKVTLSSWSMTDGKVNKGLKLWKSSNKWGILPLTEKTFDVLLQKHPKASKASNDILIEKEVQNVHPVIYNSIDSEMVRHAIKKTFDGFAGPLRLDADSSHQIFIWGNFGTSVEDLRKVIADMAKRLCQDNSVKHFETFLAGRLTPFEIQPGVRSIGVGEVLRRVLGTVTMKLLKREVLKATGSLKLCTGQDAGNEEAIHAVCVMFDKENTGSINVRCIECLQCNKPGGIFS